MKDNLFAELLERLVIAVEELVEIIKKVPDEDGYIWIRKERDR